jgi:hypothetical protein
VPTETKGTERSHDEDSDKSKFEQPSNSPNQTNNYVDHLSPKADSLTNTPKM